MSRFVAPPSELLEQIANDSSVENFKASFPNVRDSAVRYCELAGENFYGFENILDFGCGVGRFIFAFDEHIGSGQRLFGCDLNESCAKWCEQNIEFAKINWSSLLPPLPYEDESIDYINAVSVFTHLTVDLQIKWAAEIYRILRPGGVIAFTTNGVGYIPFLLGLSKTIFPVHDYRTMGSGDVLAVLSEGGPDEDEGQRAIVTFHSEGALKEIFYPLELRYYEPLSTLAGGQAIAVMKKTGRGKIIEPDKYRSSGKDFFFPSQNLSSEFRCYLSFEGDAYYAHEQILDFAITSSSGEMSVRGTPIKVQRIFADSHLVPINIPVSAQATAFQIQLGLRESGSLPPMKINWPHLISLN